MNGRTVGKTVEIDQKAVRIFLKQLPAAWLARDQQPDIHIDRVVEVVEAGELTGMNFGAQIKSFEPKPGEPTRLKYSIATKPLAYYIDKVEYPVFLFLVDTTNETVFYRFMQELGKTNPSGWRSQKSVTVNFDRRASFADQLRFTSALVEAADYTRNLHPSSVQAALGKLKNKIEITDPRVNACKEITV